MKKLIVVSNLLCLAFAALSAQSQELWVGKDGNIRNSDTRAMAAGSDTMYLATRNEVYRSGDCKEKWESVFTIPSGENEINCLANRHGSLFVGTRRGLFRSEDRGRSWSKVFKTIIAQRSDILCVETSRYVRGKILVGTCMGVYLSDDNGNSWSDISQSLKNRRVTGLVCAKGVIYASGDDGIFVRRPDMADWERVCGGSPSPEAVPADDAGLVESDKLDAPPATCVAFKDPRLYSGIGKKLSYTDDGAKSWIDMPSNGIKGDATCILPARGSDRVYCATTRGVFEFDSQKKRWLELYRGMDKELLCRSIIFDKDNEQSLWAITDNGLYKYEPGKYIIEEPVDVEKSSRIVSVIFDGEPAFRDLQAAAMKYAEVDPDKIRRWRDQARLKALVPKISVGLDNSSSNTYDIYTSATKSFVMEGPEDISRGVDVSVSWELGDMIWSDDQTNIDVRSRLTTQLRNDILDDLRRAHYERKRLQFEMMATPPKDIKMRFEKELRIKELTQAIDDLTGNYLSDHIKSSKIDQLSKELQATVG